MKTSRLMNRLSEILKMIWRQINIFDIPQLTRDISSDVKHIRKYYDDSQKAIENYKIELERERKERIKEQNLFEREMDNKEEKIWSKD